MKQKFPRGTVVRIGKLPPSQSHFYQERLAMVSGTYAQIYGGSNTGSYCLYIMDEKGEKIVNRCSWYYTDQLTALRDATQEDMLLVAKYELREDV